MFSLLLGLIGGFSKTTRERDFWTWFRQNETILFYFEKDQERIFDELSGQLAKVDSNLSFEFSSIIDGRREFIISGSGIRESFPKVESLFAAAPKLPRWIFIKFSPATWILSRTRRQVSFPRIPFSRSSSRGVRRGNQGRWYRCAGRFRCSSNCPTVSFTRRKIRRAHPQSALTKYRRASSQKRAALIPSDLLCVLRALCVKIPFLPHQPPSLYPPNPQLSTLNSLTPELFLPSFCLPTPRML